MGILVDLTPLRLHPEYRRLYVGTALTSVGAALASTAIGLQVYQLTGSSFSVGLVGLFGLVPLVALGLYGGAVVDAFDRRRVAILGSLGMWAVSALMVAQAALGNRNAWVLYALVALNSAAFAVVSPARTAIYPRILQARLLPAANALSSLSMSLAVLIGPVAAGFLIDWQGYTLTYAVDAAMFAFSLWGLAGLPPIPPLDAARAAAPGLRSVLDGLGYLASRPNLKMTFFTDFCAMILANPKALFPAVAVVALGGGAREVGLLTAATALGALLAALFSGGLTTVVHQGRAVVVAVVSWGLSIALFGLAVLAAMQGWVGPERALVLALIALTLAGASDSVSMVFRNTIMQAAADDRFRGRMQGIFIVVVAGGPRLGELVAGSVGQLTTEWVAALGGGLACAVAVVVLARAQRGFLRYDSRRPQP